MPWLKRRMIQLISSSEQCSVEVVSCKRWVVGVEGSGGPQKMRLEQFWSLSLQEHYGMTPYIHNYTAMLRTQTIS